MTIHERHIELVEAVNASTTQIQHDIRYAHLKGFRDGIEAAGLRVPLMDADLAYNVKEWNKLREQRDMLAEALRKAISWGDSASHHILHRQNINWTYLNEAREALAAVKGDNHES